MQSKIQSLFLQKETHRRHRHQSENEYDEHHREWRIRLPIADDEFTRLHLPQSSWTIMDISSACELILL